MSPIDEKTFKSFYFHLDNIFKQNALYIIGSGFCPDKYPMTHELKSIIYWNAQNELKATQKIFK